MRSTSSTPSLFMAHQVLQQGMWDCCVSLLVSLHTQCVCNIPAQGHALQWRAAVHWHTCSLFAHVMQTLTESACC